MKTNTTLNAMPTIIILLMMLPAMASTFDLWEDVADDEDAVTILDCVLDSTIEDVVGVGGMRPADIAWTTIHQNRSTARCALS
jgi:hypothetical protein